MTVPEYYENVPEASANQLNKLRSIVAANISGSKEVISYSIPCFKVNGKAVISIGGFKDHVSLFTLGDTQIKKFAHDLKDYATTKSGIHFKNDVPLPEPLIKKIIKDRIKQVNA